MTRSGLFRGTKVLVALAMSLAAQNAHGARAAEAAAGAVNAAGDSAPPAPVLKAAISAPAYAVQDPLPRLLPIDTYDGPLGGTLNLSGARDEMVDKQLLLFAAAKPWNGVRLSFSNLKGPHGIGIAASLPRWRPVGSVRTRKPYYPVRYVGLWPDPLLPSAPFDVAAGQRAAVWIDLRVPRTAPAGLYLGSITLHSNDAPDVTVPLTLRVWNFSMPRQSHIVTSFGTWNFGQGRLNAEATFNNMLEHRVSPSNAVGDPKLLAPAVDGQPLKLDWTEWDRTMERRLAQGMTAFAMHIGEPKAAWALAWQQHLREKGWLDMAYTYLGDEPAEPTLPSLDVALGEVKRAAPLLKNMMTSLGFPGTRRFPGTLHYVDIWSPNNIYFEEGPARREQQRGRAVWWYPAYPSQHPLFNVWTDYPAIDDRIWAWATWKYDLDGMLYWSIADWDQVKDPLHEAMTFGGANGDGSLVYPGPNGQPLDSIRWEALRDGLQDYEVFCLLEAGERELQARHQSKFNPLLLRTRQLLAIDDNVVRRATATPEVQRQVQYPLVSYAAYTSDPHVLLQAREEMSLTLEQIVAALGHQPRIEGRPRYRPGVSAAELSALGVSLPR